MFMMININATPRPLPRLQLPHDRMMAVGEDTFVRFLGVSFSLLAVNVADLPNPTVAMLFSCVQSHCEYINFAGD